MIDVHFSCVLACRLSKSDELMNGICVCKTVRIHSKPVPTINNITTTCTPNIYIYRVTPITHINATSHLLSVQRKISTHVTFTPEESRQIRLAFNRKFAQAASCVLSVPVVRQLLEDDLQLQQLVLSKYCVHYKQSREQRFIRALRLILNDDEPAPQSSSKSSDEHIPLVVLRRNRRHQGIKSTPSRPLVVEDDSDCDDGQYQGLQKEKNEDVYRGNGSSPSRPIVVEDDTPIVA